MKRRPPLNRFVEIAPDIKADGRSLVFVGEHKGGGFSVILRRDLGRQVRFANKGEAYNFARKLLGLELDRLGLPRTRRQQENAARKATAPAAGIGAYEANSEARQILYPAVGWLRRMRSMPEEVRSATPATH